MCKFDFTRLAFNVKSNIVGYVYTDCALTCIWIYRITLSRVYSNIPHHPRYNRIWNIPCNIASITTILVFLLLLAPPLLPSCHWLHWGNDCFRSLLQHPAFCWWHRHCCHCAASSTIAAATTISVRRCFRSLLLPLPPSTRCASVADTATAGVLPLHCLPHRCCHYNNQSCTFML